MAEVPVAIPPDVLEAARPAAAAAPEAPIAGHNPGYYLVLRCTNILC